MSFSRATRSFNRYWPSPPRKIRRPIVMRPSSAFSTLPSVRKVRLTSAIPRGLRWPLPLNMTSSMELPRSDLGLCSPSTQVMASARLLLPQPFGPTIAVMPRANRLVTGSTKVLKPLTSRLSSLSMVGVAGNRAFPALGEDNRIHA